MPVDIDYGWCEHCGRNTIFKRSETNHAVHLMVTIITGGAWLFPWLIFWLCEEGFHCIECKHAPPRPKGFWARTVLIVLGVALVAAALVLAAFLLYRGGLF